MKKYSKSIIIMGVLFSLAACSPNTKLDKLKEKRTKLKAEIAQLDEQIESLDTVQEFVIPFVESNTVEIREFNHKVIVQGDVETDQEVMVIAEANGQITRVLVEEGQSVTKGQTLARIDTDILSSNVNEVESQLEFAEYNYDKQKELFERGVGTEFDLKQAKNNLDNLRSKLGTLKTQRSKGVVKAPFSGVVDEIMAHEGEMASAQSPIMRVVNTKNVRIVGDISEHYYSSIKEGSIVDVYVPTLKDTFNLQLTSVGKYIHPTNRTFRVKASIKENRGLLPNMLAEMHITDLSLDSATVVPATGILKNQNNEDYVFALRKEKDNHKAHKVMVEIISQQNGQAAINVLNGSIKEGDHIVSAGGRGIVDGDIVRIQ